MKITEIGNYLKHNVVVLCWVGLAMLLFASMINYIDDGIKFIIDHFLWKIYPLPLGVFIICLSLITIYTLWGKTKNNTFYIQPNYIIISTVLFLCYSYFRFIDDKFQFWGYEYSGHCIIAYTDTLYVIFVFILYKRAKYQRFVDDIKGSFPMLKDCAIENESQDYFGYKQMVDSLFSDLCATDVSKEAFTVGVVGTWGLGKSSFVNLLKKRICESGSILVLFYPRSSMSEQAISTDFFNLLSKELGRFHTGALKIVEKYSKSLRKLEGDGWINKTLDAIEVCSQTNEREKMERVITEIGRKIFVVIDDLDRLTAPEILEILKITDRNGCFKNMYFIVAYDKIYVNSVLQNYLGFKGGDIFTDKYFNYEYSLPAHNYYAEKNFIYEFLKTQVNFLDDDVLNTKDLLRVWNRIGDRVVRYLGLMRHIKRFINILMSRLLVVKNDVVIGDFIWLTLLRYQDLEVYYMLSAGELMISGEQFLEGDKQMLYLQDEAIKDLEKREHGWVHTVEILKVLFPLKSNPIHYDLENDYRRIRSINAFDYYFYDEYKGKLYYNDLRKLFVLPENEAVQSAKTMFNTDQDSLILYLQSRSIKRLITKQNLKRLIVLLVDLNNYTKRMLSIDAAFGRYWGQEFLKESLNEKMFASKIECKKWLLAIFKRYIAKYPIEIGGAAVSFLKEIDEHPGSLIFTKDELITIALLGQRSYFNQYGMNGWNIQIAFQLSDIKSSEKRPYKFVKSASKSLIEFMTNHSVKIVANVIKITIGGFNEDRYSALTFYDWFVPTAIFEAPDSFEKWIEREINDTSTKYVLKKIYSGNHGITGITLNAPLLGNEHIDFDKIASMLHQQENQELDTKLLDVLTKSVGMDVAMLCARLKENPDNIKESLKRLCKKKLCNEFYASLKDQMEPLQNGDFIKLKDAKYKDIEDSLLFKVNVFRIKHIDEKKKEIELVNIDDKIPLDNIEAIPIDGKHDLRIYYDPIIAASIVGKNDPLPIHSTDYRYYLEHFKNNSIENEGTMYDELKRNNFQFVHEVQHWLRKKWHEDSLKININNSSTN